MFNYNELLEKTTDFDKKLIEQDLEIFKSILDYLEDNKEIEIINVFNEDDFLDTYKNNFFQLIQELEEHMAIEHKHYIAPENLPSYNEYIVLCFRELQIQFLNYKNSNILNKISNLQKAI